MRDCRCGSCCFLSKLPWSSPMATLNPFFEELGRVSIQPSGILSHLEFSGGSRPALNHVSGGRFLASSGHLHACAPKTQAGSYGHFHPVISGLSMPCW